MRCLLIVVALFSLLSPAVAVEKKIGGPVGKVLDNLEQANPLSKIGADDQPGAAEGPLGQALSKPFQQIANVIGGDIDAAEALATAIPTLQDGNGQQCWAGFKEFAAIIKIHPLPLTGKLASDLEAARLLAMSANKLCANAHCSQVFTELQNAVGQIAPLKIGAGVAIPSLASICAQIPQVAVAPIDPSLLPAAAPATTTTTPAAPAQP